MQTKKDINSLTNQILRSKKYRSIYKPTVKMIVKDITFRYPEKEVEKVVKRKLHQIWGAYYIRPNFDKLFSKIKKRIETGEDSKKILLELLMLQSSTKERLAILKYFYQKIFSITGIPKTILEPACGVNALTYFWMGHHIKYLGYDVDLELINFINSIFKLLKVENQARVKLGDILTEKPRPADVVLLLKVLTILEKQSQGCTPEILEKCRCKYLVASYPTKSLSGKRKGMVRFYSQQFLDLVSKKSWEVKKLLFDTELVFVIKKC